MLVSGGRRKLTPQTVWPGWLYLIILSVSFFIGAFAGIAFSFFLKPSSELSDYLIEYCSLLAHGDLHISFLSVLWDCIRWPLLAVVLGLTVLGIAGIPVLLVVRGFLLSFSICTFGLLLGEHGIVVAAVLFAVTILLVLPVLFVLSCNGFRRACMHLPNAMPSADKQFRLEILLICTGILAVSVAIQWTVIPAVLSVLCSRFAF